MYLWSTIFDVRYTYSRGSMIRSFLHEINSWQWMHRDLPYYRVRESRGTKLLLIYRLSAVCRTLGWRYHCWLRHEALELIRRSYGPSRWIGCRDPLARIARRCYPKWKRLLTENLRGHPYLDPDDSAFDTSEESDDSAA